MLSERGRNLGTKYRTSVARQNCTSMCRQVTNSGNLKLRYFSVNIHLLYCSIAKHGFPYTEAKYLLWIWRVRRDTTKL